MPKNLTTNQKTEIVKPELKTRILVTLELDDGPLRILENDTVQVLNIGGNDYLAGMVSRGDIETAMGGTVEKVNITISNIWQEISSIIANEGDTLTNRKCKVEEIIFYESNSIDDFVSSFKTIVNNDNAIEGLWIVDSLTGTIFKDLSGKNRNMTISKDISNLDPSNYKNITYFNVNASDEYFDTPDTDGLSFGNGTTDDPFCIVSFVNPNNVTGGEILGKYDVTSGNLKREYNFEIYQNFMAFQLWDNSAGGCKGRKTDAILASDIGSWHTYISTYDGSGTNSGIKIYKDAIQVDTTNHASGTYTAMENLGAKVGNYYTDAGGSKTSISSAKYGILAVIRSELTQQQITNINNLCQSFIIDDPVLLFEGLINNIQLTAVAFSFDVERVLGGYSTISPNSTYDVNCQWKFKDERCQYSGEANPCDKTWTTCRIQERFGGYPSIPKQMVISAK